MRHWWGGDIERRVGGSGLFERVEHRIDAPFARQRFGARAIMIVQPGNGETCLAIGRQMRVLDDPAGADDHDRPGLRRHRPVLTPGSAGRVHASASARACRSAEHTSELQSLMRITYSVFCLKKKTHQTCNE